MSDKLKSLIFKRAGEIGADKDGNVIKVFDKKYFVWELANIVEEI